MPAEDGKDKFEKTLGAEKWACELFLRITGNLELEKQFASGLIRAKGLFGQILGDTKNPIDLSAEEREFITKTLIKLYSIQPAKSHDSKKILSMKYLESCIRNQGSMGKLFNETNGFCKLDDLRKECKKATAVSIAGKSIKIDFDKFYEQHKSVIGIVDGKIVFRDLIESLCAHTIKQAGLIGADGFAPYQNKYLELQGQLLSRFIGTVGIEFIQEEDRIHSAHQEDLEEYGSLYVETSIALGELTKFLKSKNKGKENTNLDELERNMSHVALLASNFNQGGMSLDSASLKAIEGLGYIVEQSPDKTLLPVTFSSAAEILRPEGIADPSENIRLINPNTKATYSLSTKKSDLSPLAQIINPRYLMDDKVDAHEARLVEINGKNLIAIRDYKTNSAKILDEAYPSTSLMTVFDPVDRLYDQMSASEKKSFRQELALSLLVGDQQTSYSDFSQHEEITAHGDDKTQSSVKLIHKHDRSGAFKNTLRQNSQFRMFGSNFGSSTGLDKHPKVSMSLDFTNAIDELVDDYIQDPELISKLESSVQEYLSLYSDSEDDLKKLREHLGCSNKSCGKSEIAELLSKKIKQRAYSMKMASVLLPEDPSFDVGTVAGTTSDPRSTNNTLLRMREFIYTINELREFDKSSRTTSFKDYLPHPRSNTGFVSTSHTGFTNCSYNLITNTIKALSELKSQSLEDLDVDKEVLEDLQHYIEHVVSSEHHGEYQFFGEHAEDIMKIQDELKRLVIKPQQKLPDKKPDSRGSSHEVDDDSYSSLVDDEDLMRRVISDRQHRGYVLPSVRATSPTSSSGYTDLNLQELKSNIQRNIPEATIDEQKVNVNTTDVTVRISGAAKAKITHTQTSEKKSAIRIQTNDGNPAEDQIDTFVKCIISAEQQLITFNSGEPKDMLKAMSRLSELGYSCQVEVIKSIKDKFTVSQQKLYDDLCESLEHRLRHDRPKPKSSR